MISKEDFEVKTEAQKKIGFEKWMKEPTTRALVSMIPAADKQDLVHLVLQAAYGSGFNSGSGHSIVLMVEDMMKRDSRRP